MRSRNLLVLLLLFSCSVWSKTHEVAIELTSIKAVKQTERDGDEVFFSITQYSNKKDPTLMRVPSFPMHWLSRELPDVRDVELWRGHIEDGESILLIFSLLEQDVPPWNIDEHIGSAKVKLRNDKGKVTAVWGQPDFIDQPKVEQQGTQNPSYKMYGDGAEYFVKFKMQVE